MFNHKFFFLQPQTQQLVTDPGDLRYDLERRRQQRLEGVKITISGGSFTQIASKRYNPNVCLLALFSETIFHVFKQVTHSDD